MNGLLYQITNGKIYLIDTVAGTQTEKATLGYDQSTDTLVYQYGVQNFTSIGTGSANWSYMSQYVGRLLYKKDLNQVQLWTSDGSSIIDFKTLSYDPTGNIYPVLNILQTTTGYAASGTGTLAPDGSYYLKDGQYVNVTASLTGTINYKQGNMLYSSAANALIASKGQSLKVFDGSSISTPATVPANDGIIEYGLSRSFLAGGNVLYISKKASSTASDAYNFTDALAQQIQYDENIVALKATMNGVYVFLETKVEYLSANSLQNIAGSATFISTPLGDGAAPINNLAIAAAGDRVFYVSKNLQVQTINYMEGTTGTTIGELSARPIVSIRQFLETLDPNQPNAFAWYNENEKNVQFNLRSAGATINDYVLVYDLVNDTWNVDTQKNYNRTVKLDGKYYGFSDVNSSIYEDGVGYSDAGVPIEFKIRTNNFICGTVRQKIFGGFTGAGAIGPLTTVQYVMNVDGKEVFQDSVVGDVGNIPDVGAIADSPVGENAIADGKPYFSVL